MGLEMTEENDRKLIYIAGPYRASTVNGIHNNIAEARKRAEWAWTNGWVPICPHTNSAFIDGLVADKIILSGCIKMMSVCDAILLIDGWVKSEGARMECQLAIEMKMEIVDDPFGSRE